MALKRAAQPFDALLGVAPARAPKSRGVTVVVAGTVVTDVRQITQLLGADETDVQTLRAATQAAISAARYQAARGNPEAMAKRKAWAEQHREERREYMRQYREANRERLKAGKAAWARRKYQLDPGARAAESRKYYAANRDAVLARAKAKRDQAKQTTPATPTTTSRTSP